MRVMAVIDQREVIEKILPTWASEPARAPPPAAGPWTRKPCDDVDPMPDYKNVSPRLTQPSAPR